MKKIKIISVLISLFMILIIFSGSISGRTNSNADTYHNGNTPQSAIITDDKNIYAQDNDEVENIYITIVANNTVTLADVDAWNINSNEPKPEIGVRFEYGEPSSDVSGVTANAIMSQRGEISTTAKLKSYKIELDKAAAKWKGQDTINLNKHPFDLSRIRNKLAFDLIKMFPGTFSFRTQFCRVYIRDLNCGNKGYADYGLFTQVEDLGKDYLKNRGIEKSAYIYKANEFEFGLYPEVKNVTDPDYNKAEFEKILTIKGVEDHARLIAMLKDVNDETLNINYVIEKHFDRDNYLTWMALNLLLSNADTSVNNFYIMSPVSGDKWYFVPWDYDFALGHEHQLGFYYYTVWPPYLLGGVSMYWGSPLHRRFLEDPQNLSDLTAKVEELSAIATNEVVAAKVDEYYSSTNSLVKSNPDLSIMNTSVGNYEAEIQRLKTVLDNGKKAYYDGLKKPMPFDLYDVQVKGSKCTFNWSKSNSLDGEALSYNFYISKTPDFNKCTVKRLNLKDTSAIINSLPAGTYYWKVEAVNSSGNVTAAFDDYYSKAKNCKFFGIREFVID